jgi:hypothetical protein
MSKKDVVLESIRKSTITQAVDVRCQKLLGGYIYFRR